MSRAASRSHSARVPAYTIAGRAAGSASTAPIPRCALSFVADGTTVNDRFGRSNPVATRTGSRRPRRPTMSPATCDVAVAVEATIASAPSQRAASASRK